MSEPARPDEARSEWRRWHYRRSLASRVTLLTTMAVGLAVAFVALSAFVTARMQLQSTLDSSLLNRANKAAQTDGLRAAVTQGIPPGMFGAADVRIMFINSERDFATAGFFPSMTLGRPELDVAAGTSDHAIRTIVADDGDRYRVATVQSDDGEALVLAQPLAPQDETLRRLVADAGHELRTPLTSLRTNLDLLTQAGDEGLPRDAHEELLTDVRAQIEELTTLIGDLMELARDEQLTLVVETTDLEEILDRALARVRRRAPGITFDVDTHAWWVDGDPAALERAVTNLLDNAAKWSPPAGTIAVRLADGVLTVDDEGPGISPEDLPHVFERFYRAEESRSMPGSGLGLAIVRQVAERHGGSAEAGAAPGGGARLTMTIPGRRVESAPALPEEAATDQTLVATGRPSIVTRRTPRQGPTGP